MNDPETSARTDFDGDDTRAAAGSDQGYLAKLRASIRRRVDAGAAAAVAGGTSALGGLRAIERGDRRRGLAGLGLGIALLAVARSRSRSTDGEAGVDQTDVVDTAPDVEAVGDDGGAAVGADHVGGDAAEAVARTSPDVDGASSGLDADAGAESADEPAGSRPDGESQSAEGSQSGGESQSNEGSRSEEGGRSGEGSRSGATGDEGDRVDPGDAGLPEAVDRLGAASFDRQSREVPVPQRAFNQGFLSHSAEAFWGVRGEDDAVLVSRAYDAIEGREGVRFLASSEVGADRRELPIPDAVLNHWDETIRGGTAVVGGDGVLFVTSDDLSGDGLLRVLPANWADEPSESGAG